MAIGVAQRLRFKKQANTSCGVLKEGSFWSYFDSFLLNNAKILTKKAFLVVYLASLTLGGRTVF